MLLKHPANHLTNDRCEIAAPELLSGGMIPFPDNAPPVTFSVCLGQSLFLYLGHESWPSCMDASVIHYCDIATVGCVIKCIQSTTRIESNAQFCVAQNG